MRRLSIRSQRTIKRPAEVRGVGFLTGAVSRIRFLPAPPSSGVVFVRTDLPNRPRIPALVHQVTGTSRRTTLGRAPVQVTLVEHVLASLAGLRIDNCILEIDSVEPPGLDGSAQAFVEALVEAGVQDQPARRSAWAVTKPVTVSAGNATLTLHPPAEDQMPGLTMTYLLDYGNLSPIIKQIATFRIVPGTFHHQLSNCRTFLLESEAEQLRRQGLGARITPADLLVFGPRGPIDNHLRFANEPARHKMLDMVGDLSLLGADLWGHLVACRSGHPLNVELTRTLHHLLTGVMGRTVAA
ncbi:MAG: UDP-3-O-acyl-N-acetylglucosamine deacetylase [Gemmataceae bacterium]